jgi:hypothetical protein
MPAQPAWALLAVTLTVALGLGCSGSDNDGQNGGSGGTGGERFDSIRDAVPMERSTADELGIEPFVGRAVVPKPTAPKAITEHPILGNDGDSRIHNDHYNTGAYDRSGLTGPAIDVVSNALSDQVGACAMMTMLRNGYVLGSCFIGNPIDVTLVMFDEQNLNIVAERVIGPRPLVPNASGGAYFTLDGDENIFIGPPNNLEQYHIEVTDGVPEFVRDRSIDMTPYIREAGLLQDSVIDFDGRLWFMATTGEVGYVDLETEAVETIDLASDLEDCPLASETQVLQNSIAVDADGIYMVTCAALYRLSANAEGEVQRDWRVTYDTGTEVTGLLPGSGTSPTLFGTEDDLITICDNADEQINLLVLDRAWGTEVCKQPLFRRGESATENSSIGSLSS